MEDKHHKLSTLCLHIEYEHGDIISFLKTKLAGWEYKERKMRKNFEVLKGVNEKLSGSDVDTLFTNPLAEAEVLELNVIFKKEAQNLKTMENNYRTHSQFLKSHIEEQQDIFNNVKVFLHYGEDVQVPLPTDENIREIIRKFEYLLQTYEDLTKKMLLSYRGTNDLDHAVMEWSKGSKIILECIKLYKCLIELKADVLSNVDINAPDLSTNPGNLMQFYQDVESLVSGMSNSKRSETVQQPPPVKKRKTGCEGEM
jgi:hypothetical protein